MGLDSVTSRVVVNGKLSNKSAISRRAKYTAFLRFPKRFCGADFIDNLMNGNIKVRDSQTINRHGPWINTISPMQSVICLLIRVEVWFQRYSERQLYWNLQIQKEWASIYCHYTVQFVSRNSSQKQCKRLHHFRLGIGSLGNNQMDVFYFELLGLRFANFDQSKRNIRQCLKKTSIGIDLNSFVFDPKRNQTYCAAWATK